MKFRGSRVIRQTDVLVIVQVGEHTLGFGNELGRRARHGAAEERDDKREVGPRGSGEVKKGAQSLLVSFDESWMGGRDGRGTVDGVDDVVARSL